MTSRHGIFRPALDALAPNSWGVYGPVSFRAYLAAHGLPAVDTAVRISVDSLDRLAPELRAAGAMVLRLGSASLGAGTQFVVIGTPGQLHDFFLVDEDIFQDSTTSVYTSASSAEALLPYSILPKLTEKSMVSLAFASGLIGEALGLDKPYPTSAPASGSGTYTFEFIPHRDLPVTLRHERGQVEIDAVFLGRRQGWDCLFILESKMGLPLSLAKHKLVYPLLALAPKVPPGIRLVPVYLRCHEQERVVRFDLVECTYPDPRIGLTYLADLVPLRHVRYELPLT